MDNNPAGDGFSPNTSAPEPTPTPVTEPTAPIAEPTPILSSEPVTEPAATPVTEPASATEPTPVPSSEPAAPATEPASQSVLAEQPTATDTPTQTPATTPSPAVKGNKKPLIFALIGVFAAAVIAVIVIVLMNMSGGKGKSSVDMSSPKEVAKAYAQNLLDKKLDENFELLSLPENHFLTTSDYKDYISKNAIRKDEIGIEAKVKDVEESRLTDKNAVYNVLAEKEKDSSPVIINVSLTQNNNKWGVEEDNFYVSNWAIVVPGGTKLVVDGQDVPESLLKDDSSISKNSIKYVFPAIYSSKKEFKFNHDIEGKTVEITPLASESGKEYYIELNDKEMITKAQNYIKETWNAIYKDYVAGTNVSDVAKKYFDDTMSIETVNSYYKTALDSLSTATTKRFIDYVMTSVTSGKDSCYVIDKDIITINFGYGLDWVWEWNKDDRHMTRYSKIRLRVDGDSFKIYEVPDTKLFSYSNQFTKEF